MKNPLLTLKEAFTTKLNDVFEFAGSSDLGAFNYRNLRDNCLNKRNTVKTETQFPHVQV